MGVVGVVGGSLGAKLVRVSGVLFLGMCSKPRNGLFDSVSVRYRPTTKGLPEFT
jgi:hypothetical protein